MVERNSVADPRSGGVLGGLGLLALSAGHGQNASKAKWGTALSRLFCKVLDADGFI
jgi:hypothetical protein